MEKMRKAQKLDCFHHIYAKVVDAFVFLSSKVGNNLIDGALTVEERDILKHQQVTAEGRFPGIFPRYNCDRSFK